MMNWLQTDATQEAALDQQGNDPRGNRYEVVIRFTVEASDPEEAEAAINEIIQEGKLRLIYTEDKDKLHEYDIEEVEPAEIS